MLQTPVLLVDTAGGGAAAGGAARISEAPVCNLTQLGALRRWPGSECRLSKACTMAVRGMTTAALHSST